MAGRKARRPGGEPAGGGTVKVTIRLTVATAQRLGVEAAMSRVSQSSIVERVLASYLEGWRLPSKIGVPPSPGAGRADGAEDAA